MKTVYQDELNNKLQQALWFFMVAIGVGIILANMVVKSNVGPREVSGKIKNVFISKKDVAPVKQKEPDAKVVDGEEVKALAEVVSERYRVEPTLAQRIVRLAAYSAQEKGLPTTLVLAVIARESSFQPDAVNHNDHGLMQVNSKYHADKVKAIGGLKKLYEPEENIKVGTQILAEYVSREGTFWGGLRRYNGLDKANDYPDEVLARKSLFDAKAKISA